MRVYRNVFPTATYAGAYVCLSQVRLLAVTVIFAVVWGLQSAPLYANYRTFKIEFFLRVRLWEVRLYWPDAPPHHNTSIHVLRCP